MKQTSLLEQTFLHVPGVGLETERSLWKTGIRSWSDARDLPNFAAVGTGLRRKLDTYIPQSLAALKRRDAAFFTRLAKFGESWRLFPDFASECVFLDIETTGLSPVFDKVTMVGLFDGRRYRVFIDGQNLHELPQELKKYSVVVTFNGSGFDLRFLKLAFANLGLPPIHIDLRWATRRLGHRGGLKAVEKQLGISRSSHVADLSGYDATVLWSRYMRGDQAALDRLIAYNTEDVVHLKAIMEMSYDELAKQVLGADKTQRIYKGLASPTQNPRFRARAVKTERETLVADLLQRSAIPAPRIVGIDLTGSERRATGWALLRGSDAVTKSLVTDADLISETLAAKPDVVSIDSPLSVPDGWDQTQRRLVNGSPIYRKCELALKRMGISVFWCLLPSMKTLTMRGMRLAETLRGHGLHVIESYPGAAQDILGIPRKGSSLEELKWGMNRAGIDGAFLTGRVTHDEVDAITSALVGLFYLANDYIGLGTPTEDYLIVPRSPQIDYSRLSEILHASGLDAVSTASPDRLECKVHAGPAIAALA